MGESKSVLIVIQIELAYLHISNEGGRNRRNGRSPYLEVDAIRQYFRFCPTLRAWRENGSRAEHRKQARICILIVPCFPSPFPNNTRRRQRLTSKQPRILRETPRNTPFCTHNALSNPPDAEGGQGLLFQGAATGERMTKQLGHGDYVCV